MLLPLRLFLKEFQTLCSLWIIVLFSLDNKREELEFKHTSDKIDALLADLTIQDATNN